MKNEEEISKLLQLKRYERPREGYHEEFLREFQRRQRLASMRPSLWEEVTERVSSLLPEWRVPSSAYAVVGLFAVAFTAWILSTDEIGRAAAGGDGSRALAETDSMRMDLSSPIPNALPQPVNIPEQRFVGSFPTHYILQNRPSAENEPYSF